MRGEHRGYVSAVSVPSSRPPRLKKLKKVTLKSFHFLIIQGISETEKMSSLNPMTVHLFPETHFEQKVSWHFLRPGSHFLFLLQRRWGRRIYVLAGVGRVLLL